MHISTVLLTQLHVSEDDITEPQQCRIQGDGLVTIDECVFGERLHNMRDLIHTRPF